MISFYYVSFRFLFKRIGISKSMVDKIKIMVNHLDLPQDVIELKMLPCINTFEPSIIAMAPIGALGIAT